MLDGIPATATLGTDAKDRALASFLEFIENRLGVSIIKRTRDVPSDESLLLPLRLGELLKERGIITEFGRSIRLPDEPFTRSWHAVCADPSKNPVGGTTWESDADALYATLAEALERYLWFTQSDYFQNPVRDTVANMQYRGPFIAPERFAGFSEDVRARDPGKQLREDSPYLWIQGTSLISGGRVYLPAQTVSRALGVEHPAGEPSIRRPTTIGLATWPTQAGARLAGALEVIEREAYMVTWLNQITPPRITLSSLAALDPMIGRIGATCARYRLRPHIIRLVTDAPTHAIAVLMEDMSGVAPRFTIGLKAHRSITAAVQKAATEALRARRATRLWLNAGNRWDTERSPHTVGHRERLFYWAIPENARALEFLAQGEERDHEKAAWENDDEDANLKRVVAWCAEKGFECVAASVGASKRNPTPLHIEMVVMPELQPTYLSEETRALGGTRWKTVPPLFGYTPLSKPFVDRPHPFS